MKASLFIALSVLGLSASSALAAPLLPPQDHDGHHWHVKDREAVKQLDIAVKLLNRALPIYDGKRAEADDMCRAARREVFEATHPGAADTDRHSRLRDSDDRARFSPEQIEASQKKMRESLGHAESALRDLQHSDGSFDETGEAVRDVREAIAKIKGCVGEFDGR